MSGFMRVEDLDVYHRLCDLHIEVCELTVAWPAHERFELAAQIRRASNSSPANLAEKHSDRHVKNKIEGVNRARGEALETVHHLFIALRKEYLPERDYDALRDSYQECIRMLNGLERTLERNLPREARRFPDQRTHSTETEPRTVNSEPRTPNPEP